MSLNSNSTTSIWEWPLTTTAINAQLEELARSFVPAATTPAKARRHVEQFLRAVKHHNYARTNQFEVRQRLIGLEEKFQVLNYDDLSDALRERCLMLAQHHESWLPEGLHLLLNLSEDPLKQDAIAGLSQLDRTVAVIPVLKWADIEGDEPITRQDLIWQQPEFSDLNSDEDDIVESIPAMSPAKQAQKGVKALVTKVVQSTTDIFEPGPDPKLAADLQKSNLSHKAGDTVVMTEIQALREVLFMVQGFPTALFYAHGSSFSPHMKYRLAHLHDMSFNSLLQAVIEMDTPAREIRGWLERDQSSSLMQAFQSSVQEVLNDFNHAINGFHQRFLEHASGIASLLAVMDSIKKQAAPIVTVRNLLLRVQGRDPIDCLDAIYNSVSSAEISSNPQGFFALLKIFQTVFKTYAKSLETWVSYGILDQDDGGFFVSRVEDHHEKSTLWPAWFALSKSEANKPPPFLANLVNRILVAGKVQVFLRYLSHTSTSASSVPTLNTLIDHVCTSTNSSLIPFAPTLSSCLDTWLTLHLYASTTTLQNILHVRLNLKATLSSMSNLYFSYSSAGHLADAIDSHIFSFLDRASPSWNDSFHLADIYASSLVHIPYFDVSRINISSIPVSRSHLLTARRSVTVLSNLNISYTLPWTIANILTPSLTNPSYQRISLFLRQIRRAQYCLHRHALPAIQSSHRGDQGLRSSIRVSAGRLIWPLRITEGVYLLLHTITTTLYAHMTDCVVGSLTQRFHTRIIGQGSRAAQMIDDTIRLHHSYVQSLEMACLTALTRNISLVRGTIIGILDICLAFSFGIAQSAGKEEEDKEERRGRVEDDGLGMSVEELVGLKRKAKRAVDLLVAGLKGVARSRTTSVSVTWTESGGSENEASEMIDLLARRLELCQFR
ncbi:hypothetical protein DV736_g2778, partial [Chaetothyriales sp. CBS 134916]